MKAMIFAAGLGTRLKPFTDKMPKALMQVGDYTLLQLAIAKLKAIGIKDIVINVHHFADQVRNYLQVHQNFDCNIFISDETEELLETGGGLLKAKPLLQDTDAVLVMNVDILSSISFAKLMEEHQNANALATLAVQHRASSRNLIFDPENHQLCGWQNHKTGELKMPVSMEHGDHVAFSGIQILHPDFFELIPFTGKFSIIDVYLALCANHKISAYYHDADLVLDVGKPESLEKAQSLYEQVIMPSL